MRLAVGGALAHHVEGAPRDAEPAHAVMDAPGAEPLLGEQEAVADASEQRVGGQAHVLVEDLRVPAVGAELLPRVLHRRHVAHDVHAGRVARHDEHRRALAPRASGSVTAMTIRKSAIEPLEENHLCPSSTHPSPSRTARVFSCVGSEPGVSGSVMLKALRRSPASSGCSQRSFCSSRAGHREDLRVAGVGRGVAEGQRRDRRAAEDLVHQPEAHLAHALTAELGRQVRGPQPALLDLLLQRRDRLRQALQPEVVPDRLQRPDLAADELGHPVELRLEVGVGGEVPAHAASFRSGAGRCSIGDVRLSLRRRRGCASAKGRRWAS